MSPDKHHNEGNPPEAFRVGDTGVWANAWKVAAVLAGVGIVGAAVGWVSDPHRFAFSYLFAFVVAMTLGLGSLFLVLILYISSANWGITVRRTAEFVAAAVPVLAILIIPVLVNYKTLYAWTKYDNGQVPAAESQVVGGEQGATEEPLLGAATAHAQEAPPPVPAARVQAGQKPRTPMEEAEEIEVMHGKTNVYLSKPFWFGRTFFYLGVWILLSMLYFRWSTRQDQTKDKSFTVKAQKLAPAGLILLGMSLTFAAFDWIMSLEPTWFSTIYGVILFAGCAMSIFALVILITLSMREHGLLGSAVNVEHYHDMGKLMFGFVCFWTYTSFAQWMLIWYASIPEEVTYYQHRWANQGWKAASLLLIFGHFVVPFLYLISRVPKRKLGMLKVAAGWLLFMQVLDMYWWVMPAATPVFSPNWLDLACLLAVVGVFFSVVFYLMRKYPLVPIGDPRLERALHFHQTQ